MVPVLFNDESCFWWVFAILLIDNNLTLSDVNMIWILCGTREKLVFLALCMSHMTCFYFFRMYNKNSSVTKGNKKQYTLRLVLSITSPDKRSRTEMIVTKKNMIALNRISYKDIDKEKYSIIKSWFSRYMYDMS